MHRIIESYLSFFIDKSNFDLFSKEDLNFISYCLLHKEERENDIRDQWGNWDFPYTSFNFQKPYLDEFIINKLSQNKIRQKNIWGEGKRFAIHISHDVDFVSENDPKILNRNLVKRKKFKQVSKAELLSFYKNNFFKKEINSDSVWNCFDRLMQELQKLNFISTFYFFSRPSPDNIHLFDCDYLFSDRVKYFNSFMTVSEMIRKIKSQGFEIGLHTSYNTFNDSRLLIEQKVALENIIQAQVNSTRQHWLHYDINSTPVVQKKCQIKLDSTLGFNRNVGFRVGTCFPYYLSDKDYNFLELIELPMILMDGALFATNSLELDEKFAIKKSFELLSEVEKVGGCLTINFHPNYLNMSKWWNTFTAILQEAKVRNAACVNTADIINLMNNLS